MTALDELLDLEHRFWDASSASYGAFYRANCTPDAVFVFGPTGPIDLDACVDAVERNDVPWAGVRLSGSRLVSLGDAAAVVTYRASARRGDDPAPVELYVGSAYRRVDGAWRMAFHQQTPVVGWGAG